MAEVFDFGLQQHKIKMGGKFFENNLFAVAGDTGRRLEVQLLDSNNMIQNTTGISLRLNANVSGQATYAEATLVDATKGLYELDLPNGMLIAPGNWQFQWQIIGVTGEKLHSFAFTGSVGSNLSEGGSEATNFYLNVDDLKQMQEDLVNGTFNSEVLETNIAEKLNNLEEQYAPELTEVTAQLAEKATKSYVESKFGTLGNTFTFKGSCLFSALPTAGASSGDYWYVTDKATNYAYNGNGWSDVGNSVSVELENIEGIDNMKNGFIKRFLPQNHWLQNGWSGTALTNVTNRTSVRVNQTIDSTFDLINTNESLYEVRAYKYNNETDVLENTFLAPAYDLPAGNYKFDLRNPDSTINFYAMTQDNRTALANAIVLINVGKIRIPYLEKEIDDIKMKKIDKPFVIIDFDWYTYMHQERYEIVKKEYGFNASFCLDERTTDYNMNDYLPRDEYNNLIENGWDVALYGGTPDELITDNSSYEYWYSKIKNLVDQKKTIGIFNPYTYNVPSNQNTENIRKAVKDNGFKLMRATTDGNFIKNSDDFALGAVYMSTSTVSSIKTKIDTCIANTYGICLYTHKVLPDSGNINDGQDAAGGHIYETSFRQILNYIKPLVDSGKLEVLTTREYFSKYNPEEAIEFDENRNVKMQNFILSKVTM